MAVVHSDDLDWCLVADVRIVLGTIGDWASSRLLEAMLSGAIITIVVLATLLLTIAVVKALANKNKQVRVVTGLAVASILTVTLATLWPYLMETIGFLFIMIVWIIGSIVGLALVSWVANRIWFTKEKMNHRKLIYRQRQEEKERRLREIELETKRRLLCPPTPIEIDVDMLPKKLRTTHLRFMKLKARVCKQFSN